MALPMGLARLWYRAVLTKYRVAWLDLIVVEPGGEGEGGDCGSDKTWKTDVQLGGRGTQARRTYSWEGGSGRGARDRGALKSSEESFVWAPHCAPFGVTWNTSFPSSLQPSAASCQASVSPQSIPTPKSRDRKSVV